MNLSNLKVIKNILVDMDGTLVYTKEANIYAYQEAFKNIGLPFDKAKFESCEGLSFLSMIEKMAPGLSRETRDQVRIEKASLYKNYFHLIQENTALVRFLVSQKKNCRLAIVSTAQRQNGLNVLNFFGLAELFDCKVFAEDVENSKPAPDAYLKALKLLKSEPHECLALEDSEIGVMSATRAGVPVMRI